MPGSLSSVPMRTTTSSSEDGCPLNSADPHVEQNSFGTPSGGLKARTSSEPLNSLKPSRGTNAFAEDAVPVRRWQCVQWQ
jgi:hypothetical protein